MKLYLTKDGRYAGYFTESQVKQFKLPFVVANKKFIAVMHPSGRTSIGTKVPKGAKRITAKGEPSFTEEEIKAAYAIAYASSPMQANWDFFRKSA